MLYNLLNNLIVNGRFEKEDMTNKLNVFYTFNQISVEQYQELLGKVNPVAVKPIEDKKEETKPIDPPKNETTNKEETPKEEQLIENK